MHQVAKGAVSSWAETDWPELIARDHGVVEIDHFSLCPSAVKGSSVTLEYCISIPTLFREKYMDCLRVLKRKGDPTPFVTAMQKIQDWTIKFDYKDLDAVINLMKTSNA